MSNLILDIAASVVCGSLLLGLAWQRPSWVIFASLASAALFDLFGIGAHGINVGIFVYFDDVACAIVLGTALLVLLRYTSRSLVDLLPCAGLLALVLVSFSRGVSIYGLKQAGNSSRDVFCFAAPAFAIMVLLPTLRLAHDRLARWVVYAGLCLSAIALLRWIGVLPTPVELSDNMRELVRTIPSDFAIVVGQACIAAIYLQLVERRGAWWWGAAGILGVITLALQHRSVWSATVAGVAWLALRNARRISPIRWFVMGVAIIGTLGGIAVAAPGVLGLADSIISVNVAETQSNDNTWEWRVKGYQEATDRALGGETIDLLIGPPAGWAANSGGSFASTHIHSRYVSMLAYYGITGCVCLLLWFVFLIKRIAQSGRRSCNGVPIEAGGATLLEALLLSEIIYQIPYSGGILQCALLGLLWVAARQRIVQVSPQTSTFLHHGFTRKRRMHIPAEVSI